MIAIVWSHTANEFTEILKEYHVSSLLSGGMYATGIFFFLSGYGLTLSIKRNKVDRGYIRIHLQKLLLPYLIFWLFYILSGLLCGYFPVQGNIWVEFISLKIPNADTWFFRTIFVLYILYFSLARFIKRYAGIGITLIITVYVAVLICCGVSPWWWNTIICFPLGILYAGNPQLCRKIPLAYLLGFVVLFVFSYKFLSVSFVGAICSPAILCLICAYISPRFSIPANIPVLTFIGTNSLFMYFMETLPIDYLDSGKVGFVVFVIGGIAITIALTYLGKYVEPYVKKLRIFQQ